MRQNHQGHYHQKINQRQLLVPVSIAFETFISVSLMVIDTGTLSSQTDEYDDYHPVEYCSSPTARNHNGTTYAEDSERYCEEWGEYNSSLNMKG